ncbi:OmpA/MotB family protein [Paucidesulfovibrio longus]|uniref:OmpA/MotB family protein n=1 Tax=Paucidesulfovibrio longus TaxID=889 RepID=UPI0003B44FBF|nr:OmpA family protein [Paucidesulfovibrio longus]
MKPFVPKRKPRDDDPDSGWSLTLADMMTLLLCFFVLMLTVAKVDRDKYDAMSSVMAQAMGGKAAPVREGRPLDGAVRTAVGQEQKNLFELQLELAALIGQDRDHVELKMRAEPHAVAISLGDRILFDLGKAELKPAARALLARLAGPLSGTRYALTIEGHTDNLPIQSAQFPSNWELSSARASAVARFFIEDGFPKERIRVVGLADTRPKASNDTEEGRRKNRRVVILVRPDLEK